MCGDVLGVGTAVPHGQIPQVQPSTGGVQTDPLPIRRGYQTACGSVQHDVVQVEQPNDGPERRASRVLVRQTEVGLKSRPSSSYSS